jgi:hypothetical protein
MREIRISSETENLISESTLGLLDETMPSNAAFYGKNTKLSNK